MKQRERLTGSTAGHALGIMVAGGFLLSGNNVLAAEKKSYSKPPIAAFSSQMPDALLGNDKYEKPVWNLHDTLKLPEWLSVSLEHRTRYETRDASYRANGVGGDQQIALQTDLWLEAKLGAFRVGTEFLDARGLNSDTGTGINNTHANQADFLQGYVAWSDQNIFYSGIGTEIIAGRQTLNFGSRRLVGRNAFRNTMNNFTGGRLRLTDYKNWQFNGFVTMPVLRRPTAANDILTETHQWDKEDTHTLFSGGFLELYNLGLGINGELYLYHLDESDGPNNPTRNRRFFTPGLRFYIKPAKSQADFQLEAVGQFGTVRATTAATDGRDLTHEAWFQHADVGYTFDMPWSPRLGLEYDYASGDKNPNDGKDQRFDTLYGVRRGDFGPTGIYGAFARSNINSPGYRVNVAPRSDVQVALSHRLVWLASSRDSWTTAGLQDVTGRSGNFVGHQLDLSTRWDFNSSLNFDTGWTHLFKGNFAKNAPSAPNQQDIDYFYVESQLRF
ncbi:MAG: alginate export family protein [Methylobacter sp.]